MNGRLVRTILMLAALCLVAHGHAQEGHPLTGTWSGDWGPMPNDRHHLTIVMNWDGQRVSGMINPGPDAIPIDSVSLNPSDWTIHLEAARSNGHIVADGRLEDLGSPHRTIAGTWRQRGTTGVFKVRRE